MIRVSIFTLVVCTMFTGCVTPIAAEKNQETVGQASNHDFEIPSNAQDANAVIRTVRPRLAGEEIEISSTDPAETRNRPANFDSHGVDTFTRAGRQHLKADIYLGSIQAVADRIKSLTGVVVDVSPEAADAVSLGGNVPLQYEGQLSGLLDLICSKYDLYWEWRGKTVQISRDANGKSVWILQPGASLRKVVAEWAARAGWQVEWNITDEQTQENLDVMLGGGLVVKGTFKDATTKLFASLPESSKIRAQLWAENNPPLLYVIKGEVQ